MYATIKTMLSWTKLCQFMLASVCATVVNTTVISATVMSTKVSAAVIFSAAPIGEQEDAIQTFAPLAKYLEEIIGEKVVYQHPANWNDYSINMRNGKYDIVFDAPHFGSWRIKNINHTPIVRLPGKLGYVILAKKSNENLNTLRDLLGVKICALESPRLGTMTVYRLFSNPVFMPQIREVKGNFIDVYNELKSGKCEAAVLQDITYQHLIPAEKREVKVITKSAQMPQRTLTIGPKLLNKRRLIADKLMSSKGTRAAAKLLSSNGVHIQSFIYVKKSEYKGLESLLTDAAWGW